MTYQDDDAMKEYRECWRRAIFDATGDNSKALRALELADLNGLFDPLAEIERLRKLIAWCRPRLKETAYRTLLDRYLDNPHVASECPQCGKITLPNPMRVLGATLESGAMWLLLSHVTPEPGYYANWHPAPGDHKGVPRISARGFAAIDG